MVSRALFLDCLEIFHLAVLLLEIRQPRAEEVVFAEFGLREGRHLVRRFVTVLAWAVEPIHCFVY